MKKNTKGVILKQKGAKMAEDGEDWNRLEMTILKSLANFFKINERWRSSFNGISEMMDLHCKSSYLRPHELRKVTLRCRIQDLWSISLM